MSPIPSPHRGTASNVEMTVMTLAAEFYAGTRAKSPVLDIVRIGNGQRDHVETILVINKREARAVARDLGATPWNF